MIVEGIEPSVSSESCWRRTTWLDDRVESDWVELNHRVTNYPFNRVSGGGDTIRRRGRSGNRTRVVLVDTD